MVTFMLEHHSREKQQRITVAFNHTDVVVGSKSLRITHIFVNRRQNYTHLLNSNSKMSAESQIICRVRTSLVAHGVYFNTIPALIKLMEDKVLISTQVDDKIAMKMEIFEICGKVMNSRRSDNFSGGASFDLLKKFHLTTSWMIYHLHDSPQWD